MNAEERAALANADVKELGRRVRSARLAMGMTQEQLAGPSLSIAYISRIEAGQRRPSQAVMDQIAQRLGSSVGVLLPPRSKSHQELMLRLSYAELSLESGEAQEAEQEALAIESALQTEPAELGLVERTRYVRARALEAQGRLNDAILVLEETLQNPGDGLDWVKSSIALSRCYRESGDFVRAIALGESAIGGLVDQGLQGSDEIIQLTVTMAASYFERGDVDHAIRLCKSAIASAEACGSPKARAAAYWNASMLEAQGGALANAIPLARKALALLADGEDARNLARLRSQLGIMLLRADPPGIEEAEQILERAGEEFRASSASPVDVARNDLARARGMVLAGRYEPAMPVIAEVLEVTGETAPLIAADAQALLGQVAAAEGDLKSAKRSYRSAVHVLTGIGADRTAAQLWFELGGLMDEIGESDGARDAYRRAAASTGLQVRVELSRQHER